MFKRVFFTADVEEVEMEEVVTDGGAQPPTEGIHSRDSSDSSNEVYHVATGGEDQQPPPARSRSRITRAITTNCGKLCRDIGCDILCHYVGNFCQWLWSLVPQACQYCCQACCN